MIDCLLAGYVTEKYCMRCDFSMTKLVWVVTNGMTRLFIMKL